MCTCGLQGTNSRVSEEERELLELQKHYYIHLQNIFNNNISGVLTSPTNAPNLQQIMETIVQGCIPSTQPAPSSPSHPSTSPAAIITDLSIPKVRMRISCTSAQI